MSSAIGVENALVQHCAENCFLSRSLKKHEKLHVRFNREFKLYLSLINKQAAFFLQKDVSHYPSYKKHFRNISKR